jgi:hypothetical protein
MAVAAQAPNARNFDHGAGTTTPRITVLIPVIIGRMLLATNPINVPRPGMMLLIASSKNWNGSAARNRA